MKRLAFIVVTLLMSASTLRGQIFTWTTAGDKVGDSDFASMIWAKSFSVADTVSAVNQLKNRPAGMRCLFLWADNHAIFSNAQDQINAQNKSLWWPKGTADALAKNGLLVAQLKAAKVTPDVVVLDNEDIPGFYNLTAANVNAIAADPRGAALGVVPVAGDEDSVNRFDDVALSAANAAIWKGIFSPFHTYAPNATLSQFGSLVITPAEAQVVRDGNNHAVYMSTQAGTAASPAVYGAPGLNPLTQTPYGSVVQAENVLRVASNHGAVLPWYGGDSVGGAKWQGTNYWGEAVRQGLLTCGLKGLLFDAGQANAVSKFRTIYNETKTLVGGKMPTTLCSSDFIDPNVGFIVTARADNWTGSGGTPTRIVGRVTFAPGVTSATFTVANQSFTVTPAAGQAGAWFTYGTTSGSATQTSTASTTNATTTPKTPTPGTPYTNPIRRIVPH